MPKNARCAELLIEAVPGRYSVDDLSAVVAQQTTAAVLRSARPEARFGRFSIFAADPVTEVAWTSTDRPCTSPGRWLDERLTTVPHVDAARHGLPFVGGWIGYLAYEAGWPTTGSPRVSHRHQPRTLACFRLYDSALVFDHLAQAWHAVAVEWPSDWMPTRPRAADRLRGLLRTLALCPPSQAPHDAPIVRCATASMSRTAYEHTVRRILDLIRAGDAYQVNLALRFTTPSGLSAADLFARLIASNPGSHAALIAGTDHAILSSSSELFLELRDGHVTTRPIKGTRPRTDDVNRNAENVRALIDSEKERAELNMIVDLLRNDLNKVCDYRSVRVTDAAQIEAHPTVFHRVATIEGDLRPGYVWHDLLDAAFPGGSVTGAPKLRAMQIIDELEPDPRAVYCGSIGYIGLNGDMSLNVAIRTMTLADGKVSFHAGGAITADSDPACEYEEILAKARGMMNALNCRIDEHDRTEASRT